MPYVDAHTHLDHCLPEGARTMRDVAPEIAVATAEGVTTIVQSGTDVGSSLWAVAVASRFPTVWATVGFHPHDARDANEDALAAIAALTAHPRVIAVGEVGLDYHYDYSPRDAQREAFVWHLELARDADLPAVIHTREADDHTLALLAEHGEGLTIVLHCFSMPDRLEEVVARGYYVSFAGNVTYKKAERLRIAAASVPVERLLVETDAPYLRAEPKRGRPNRPVHVLDTYRFLAELRNTSAEALGGHVWENARRAFPRLVAS
jgi:TatD DNase family protein